MSGKKGILSNLISSGIVIFFFGRCCFLSSRLHFGVVIVQFPGTWSNVSREGVKVGYCTKVVRIIVRLGKEAKEIKS